MESKKGGCLESWKGGNETIFQAFTLAFIFVLAFSLRLFAVVRFESIIHEFDPWFNYRSTRTLVADGAYEFFNWFDNKSWYPLGRWVGGTVYPGLMWTAGLMHYLANSILNIPVHIREVCVFTAPIFAGNTAVVTYLMTKECWSSNAGLFAAFFISMVPGYVSRSVAGSYDNEAIAIFCMMLTFYFWVKSVNTGSMFYGCMCACAYGYMVAAWGGYIYLTNVIPVHCFFLLFTGRYSHRLYVSYCTWYIVGTLLSMQIMFVSFAPVSSPEHAAAFGVFGVLQIFCFYNYLTSLVKKDEDRRLIFWMLVFGVAMLFVMLVVFSLLGKFPGLTARFLALIGSTKNIAIVKSVSEHQPTAWDTYWFDTQSLTFFALGGILLCFKDPSDANLFPVLYAITASYFSNIMIRLMLVIAPALCVLGGIAMSEIILTSFDVLVAPTKSILALVQKSDEKQKGHVSYHNKLVSLVVIVAMCGLLVMYATHCTWVTSIAYSSPSVVLQARRGPNPVIFDDFREAYQWLYHNTHPDDKVLSWWDYGYQMTGMGNKTVIVDNNTRNNTHIATVGLVMASTEEEAYPIVRRLDVKYLLVVFGGIIGYSSDDINKFLWMVRISGGIYPRIVESNYYTTRGYYGVDDSLSNTMKNCMMYKMCYYRFEKASHNSHDRSRNSRVGHTGFKFKYFEEAYTTEHWMVRIYRVKDIDQVNRVTNFV